VDAAFRLPSAVPHDRQVDDWFEAITDPFRMVVRPWFDRMRGCGSDVRELVHDGCPTACVGDLAFGYVGAFKAHASIGFFNGAALPDPDGLLEGDGKRMRHVKLRPGRGLNEEALGALVIAAYDAAKQTTAENQE